jgi:exonuclease VII small subunit
MVVHSANEHALRKYEEFTSALETVRVALEEADPVIRAMKDSDPARTYGWKVPAKKEVVTARKKVTDLLDKLRAESKKYEKELIANGWRV